MSEASAVPAYSSDGLGNRDIFFAAFPGVHFFVEDDEQQNLYEKLFARCFPWIEAMCIFPQGGKGEVLKHASSGYEAYPGVHRVYVLDRDFDDLFQRLSDMRGVFYLDHYGIENVLIDENSITELCVEESPKRKRSELRAELDYGLAMSRWMPHLDELHRAFVLAQRFQVPVKNTGASIDCFVNDQRRFEFDDAKVRAYIDKIFDALESGGIVGDRAEFDVLMESVFPPMDASRINGKFLLSLFYFLLKHKGLAGNIKTYSMAYRCAGSCDLSALQPLILRINSFLGRELIGVGASHRAVAHI